MCRILASRVINYIRWPERHLLPEKSKEFQFLDTISALLNFNISKNESHCFVFFLNRFNRPPRHHPRTLMSVTSKKLLGVIDSKKNPLTPSYCRIGRDRFTMHEFFECRL